VWLGEGAIQGERALCRRAGTYLDPHGVEQDTVDEGREADVEGHLEPLSHGHEGEDRHAHAQVRPL
jgi:hypothetical protein